MRSFVGSGYLVASSAIRTIHGRLRGSSDSARTRTRGEGTPVRPRVLVISPYSVHPLIHGGAVRIFNLIRELSRSSEVSVMIFGGGTDDPSQRAALEPFCRRVLFQKYPEEDPDEDPWRLLPPSVARFASGVVAERIAAIIDAHLIDVVFLEYTEMGRFIGPYERARVVLVEHDLSFRSHSRQRSLKMDHRYDAGEVLGSGLGDWLRRYNFELGACRAADQVHVMSATDRDTLASLLPDGRRRIRVIPNGVDIEHFQPRSSNTERRDALFVGSFPHLPNQDAFDYLVAEIWPRVLERLPSARLTVAGARPPRRILDLDGVDGLRVVGEVPDLKPLYQTHRVLTVPIRAGSGTRLKILEAMASGLPVVSTTIGAEGIDCRPGQDLLIADDAQSMADAVAVMLEADDAIAVSLATNARKLVTDSYSWSRIGDELNRAVADLVPADSTVEVTEDPPTTEGETRPEVSIIISVRRGGAHLQRCLDGVARQQTDRKMEIVAVDQRGDRIDHSLLERHEARIAGIRSSNMAAGSAVNLGVRTARGDVLVFLAEDAVPADHTWLESMVRPFDSPDSPAAVQGGLHTQLQLGGPPYDPFFTAETRAWRENMGGFAFSMANAAMDRRVWERFPFAGSTLVGRHWQRQAKANGLLILPRWDAVVHWNPPAAPVQLISAAIEEGRAWKRLGVRYSTGSMVADIRRGRGPEGSDAEAAPTPPELITRGHRIHGLLRPFFLWTGNHLF